MPASVDPKATTGLRETLTRHLPASLIVNAGALMPALVLTRKVPDLTFSASLALVFLGLVLLMSVQTAGFLLARNDTERAAARSRRDTATFAAASVLTVLAIVLVIEACL
mgnify:CR=1 FL=1